MSSRLSSDRITMRSCLVIPLVASITPTKTPRQRIPLLMSDIPAKRNRTDIAATPLKKGFHILPNNEEERKWGKDSTRYKRYAISAKTMEDAAPVVPNLRVSIGVAIEYAKASRPIPLMNFPCSLDAIRAISRITLVAAIVNAQIIMANTIPELSYLAE